MLKQCVSEKKLIVLMIAEREKFQSPTKLVVPGFNSQQARPRTRSLHHRDRNDRLLIAILCQLNCFRTVSDALLKILIKQSSTAAQQSCPIFESVVFLW